MKLSVIIPIKDERENIKRLHDSLNAVLAHGDHGRQDSLTHSDLAICRIGHERAPDDYEIIFVDDGSTDGSYNTLHQLACADPHVKVLRLRRNFGQSAALQAGIDHASGDVLITMDGDMQNDPADIPMLVDKLNEGYDAVLGQRANRQDNFLIRKLPSLMANWLIRKVTGSPFRDMGCTMRAIRRDLASALSLYGEMHRFISVLIQFQGARMIQVPVRHHPRIAGKTKYNLTRTVRVVLDLITVKFMHSYLTRPMHVLGLAGLTAMGFGFLALMATIIMRFGGVDMTGNPLLLLSVLLEVTGVQFISMGLIGEVMTRTYFESQGKRAYAIQDTLNMEAVEVRRAA